MKHFFQTAARRLPQVFACAALGTVLLLRPQEAAEGVRSGLSLLATNVIPALFPFLVLSSYLAKSGVADGLGRLLRRPLRWFFRLSEGALPALVMGLTGGYPVGAKTAAELYESGRVTQNEAERLLWFSCTVSPAFAVSYVGAFTLGNARSGLLLYGAAVLAALTLGFLSRFLSDGQTPPAGAAALPPRHVLTGAVTAGTQAMVSIAGWVVTFTALARLIPLLPLTDGAALFLTGVTEVTTGCRAAAGRVSLPVLGAMLGFGGLAVLCQMAVFAERCEVPLKRLLAARLVSGALTAAFTEGLLRLFPQAAPAAVLIGTPRPALAAGPPAAALLLLTAAVFVKEVDSRRKLC